MCPQGQDQWGGPHQLHLFPLPAGENTTVQPLFRRPSTSICFSPSRGYRIFLNYIFSKLGCSFEDPLGERYLDILSIGTL